MEMALKNLKYIKIILIALIFYNVFSVVYSHKDLYTFNYWHNFSDLKKMVYDSVYKNKHGNFIKDFYLYSYSAGALIKGESPIITNPEAPPLGKYLIGASILIFNNPNVVIFLFSLLSLFLMYLVGKQIFGNSLIASLPPLLFSFEPIFKNQLIYTPLLDLMQLSFLLLIFYFFNRARITRNSFFNIFLSAVFLGAFISTKFFGSGAAIIVALVIPLLIHKDYMRLKQLIISLPVAVLFLYSTYLKVLLDGYPLNKFLGIQKWIFLYNTGHLRQPFTIWPLLLINKWYNGNAIAYDPQWFITWPLITVISFLTLMRSFIARNTKLEIEILLVSSLSYLILMSLGDASARYFVILIPVLYIIATYGVYEFLVFKFPKLKRYL